ncbi:unnamed protein product [Prorocentrum cordatum]|uniref:Peroxisomal membrane protein PEX16 n=1 Tax=Prorocentrum cordatum TaxID=2364126 RepID=A0ABN9X4N3_9DINO|nr:unnamed protein product [Polarella glacialis]
MDAAPLAGLEALAPALSQLLALRQVLALAGASREWRSAFACDAVWLALLAARWGEGARERARGPDESEARPLRSDRRCRSFRAGRGRLLSSPAGALAERSGSND